MLTFAIKQAIKLVTKLSNALIWLKVSCQLDTEKFHHLFAVSSIEKLFQWHIIYK